MKKIFQLTVIEIYTQMPPVWQWIQADQVSLRLFYLLSFQRQLLLGERPELPLG